MAKTTKAKQPSSIWDKAYPVGAPEQYRCGAYTIVDGSPKAVLLDGRVIAYAQTIGDAMAAAEAHMGRQADA